MRDCQKCNSEDVRKANKYYDERGLVEYSVFCNKCNHRIGTWAYGYWDENEDGEDE